MKYNKILFWIFLVSLFVSSIFYTAFNKHDISGDDDQYDRIAWNMASGHGYSLSTQAPYLPTNWREPSYIIFLYLVYKLFGHNLQAVYVAQILLFSISCILIFFITNSIFNKRIAMYTAFLTAMCPTLANHTIFLYSESFFIFLLIFSMYTVLRAKDTQSVVWYATSGLIMSLMVLCKIAMLFFIVPVIFYLYLNKRTLKIIFMVLIFFIPVALWSARSYNIYGTFSLTGKEGPILLARAYKAEYSLQKIKKMAVYNFSEYIGSRLFPDSKIESNDFQFQDDRKIRKEYEYLINQGKNIPDINKIMKKEALSIIKNNPIGYLIEMPLETLKLTMFMYLPSLNEEKGADIFKNMWKRQIILSAIKGAYKMLSFVILILAVMGCCIRRIDWKKELIILAPIIYINVFYSILGGYQRYAVPLIPFYFMYVSIAVTYILERRVR